MTTILNQSVAVQVVPFDEQGAPLSGVRFDVDKAVLQANKGLQPFVVTPSPEMHSFGNDAVKLYADNVGLLKTAAPVINSKWSMWINGE